MLQLGEIKLKFRQGESAYSASLFLDGRSTSSMGAETMRHDTDAYAVTKQSHTECFASPLSHYSTLQRVVLGSAFSIQIYIPKSSSLFQVPIDY